jgi:hypothetical protein
LEDSPIGADLCPAPTFVFEDVGRIDERCCHRLAKSFVAISPLVNRGSTDELYLVDRAGLEPATPRFSVFPGQSASVRTRTPVQGRREFFVASVRGCSRVSGDLATTWLYESARQIIYFHASFGRRLSSTALWSPNRTLFITMPAEPLSASHCVGVCCRFRVSLGVC